MKAYTDLNQSKVLAYILPHDTADQTYERFVIAGVNFDVPEEMLYKHNGDVPFKFYSGIGLPCWSLAALLRELPETILGKDKDGYVVMVETKGGGLTTFADDPVDACYEMIIKLNEQKLL